MATPVSSTSVWIYLLIVPSFFASETNPEWNGEPA